MEDTENEDAQIEDQTSLASHTASSVHLCKAFAPLVSQLLLEGGNLTFKRGVILAGLDAEGGGSVVEELLLSAAENGRRLCSS